MATSARMHDDLAISRERSSILPRQSGQTLLEVALLMPLLLALLLGVIDLGRFGYLDIMVANAARAGAGYGAQNLAQSVDTTGITDAADNDYQNNGEPVSTLNVSVLSPQVCGCDNGGAFTAAATGCNGAGSGTCAAGHWVVTVSVTASGKFDPLFPYPGIPNPITLSSTSTMRVAQ